MVSYETCWKTFTLLELTILGVYCANVRITSFPELMDISLPCIENEASFVENVSTIWYWSADLSDRWIPIRQLNDNWDQNLADDRRNVFVNSTLLIKSAQLNDSGWYSCIQIDSNETVFDNHTIKLIITELPYVQLEVNVLNSTSVNVSLLLDSKMPEQFSDYSTNILVRDQYERIMNFSFHPPWLILDNLHPFTMYEFIIVDDSGIPVTRGSPISIQMPDAAPSGRPKIISTWKDSNQIGLKIKLPDFMEWNGNLTGYLVSYKVEGSEETRTFVEIGMHDEAVNITRLQAYTNYFVQLAVVNSKGQGPYTDPLIIQTNEGVPSAPRNVTILRRSNDSITVSWEIPEKFNGVLIGYEIAWTNKYGYKESKHVKENVHYFEITGLESYSQYDMCIMACTKAGSGLSYDVSVITDVTAPSAPQFVNASVNQNNSVLIGWARPLKYQKIDAYYVKYWQKHSKSYSNLTVSVIIINEWNELVINSLEIGKVYKIQVAAVTRSLFTEMEYMGTYSNTLEFSTSEDVPLSPKSDATMLAIIVGILSTSFFILVAILGYILLKNMVKNRYQFVNDQDLAKAATSVGLVLMEIYDPKSCERGCIPVEKYTDHVASLHADGDYLLSQEYEEINHLTPTTATTFQSSDELNKNKNRYLNILAYDHSRVILKQQPGKPRQTDYINANFVNGYQKAKAYIATQGPLPTTFGDFWRMIWEQNSAVIVMITNLTEKGRRKCDQYWPSEGEHQYDNFTVRLVNTSVTAHYTVRIFLLKPHHKHKKFGAERTVVQYHYTDWPDHGVPAYTLPTLSFVIKSAAANPSSAGPPVVHCSAGVGRTGTYIVIDSMIRQIKDLHSINVFSFLLNIRNQRNYLVQTEDQYSFIHDALLEFIQSGGETEIKSANVSQYLKELHSVDQASSETLLEKQYKLVTAFEPKSFHFSSAFTTVNIVKNRAQLPLPVEMSRVYLPTKAGIEGSDYINASFLQGYSKNEEYIVTQFPLTNTIDDFWNMVWDQNSETIVLLCQINEEDGFGIFWPKKNESMDCGHFQVSFREEKETDVCITIEFILQSTQDDYECTVQMLLHNSWPQNCSSFSSMLELVNIVARGHYPYKEVNGPVIVIDRFGGTDAAKFCALSTLLNQMNHEGCVDVYDVAKLYHMKRPGTFPTLNDYLFLYKAVESLETNDVHIEERDSDTANSHPTTDQHALQEIKFSNSTNHNGTHCDTVLLSSSE